MRGDGMSEIFGMADAYKSAQSRSEYGMSTMNMDISVVIDMANEIESLRAQLDEAKALVLEEAVGYQDDIERYHQRALKAEAQLAAQEGERHES